MAVGPGAGDWVVKWNDNFAISGTTISFGEVGNDGKYRDGETYHINLKGLLAWAKANGFNGND